MPIGQLSGHPLPLLCKQVPAVLKWNIYILREACVSIVQSQKIYLKLQIPALKLSAVFFFFDLAVNQLQKLLLVCTEAKADGHWVEQSASIEMWIKLSYWLIQSLLASGSVQTSTRKLKKYEFTRKSEINWIRKVDSLSLYLFYTQ